MNSESKQSQPVVQSSVCGEHMHVFAADPVSWSHRCKKKKTFRESCSMYVFPKGAVCPDKQDAYLTITLYCLAHFFCRYFFSNSVHFVRYPGKQLLHR